MYVQPYLFFNGRCEEALEYYRDKLGAQILLKMHFRDAPPNPDQPINPALADKVMHTSFQIGTTVLMGSDGDCNAAAPQPAGFSLSLTADDEASAKRYYDALAQDGKVTMPFQKTFWAKGFGMLVDRFGIAWMVSVPEPE
ncbi:MULTISPECIES: VOC family protein [Paraburkholderia]|uniref:VOC family protein n=1 Tax=Paraburkholderia TaxID=1822464 RepID=UPI00224D2A26|nr:MULTISPECIES: VOC family protein [Paraburkholderia]MCX4165407.1 VOC family protein [Paraburkholderia megapolitana]MDN7160899.1 VOC family protein [Paraburkholderia sp. CHISQ3]MDQ6497946.1 VOC family protein [Paraburkholderia megapolitana]